MGKNKSYTDYRRTVNTDDNLLRSYSSLLGGPGAGSMSFIHRNLKTLFVVFV